MYSLKYALVALVAVVCMHCAPKTGDQMTKTPPATPEPPAVTDFRSMAPEAGPARKIELGTYETFTLDNGLRVIVVENHKIPRVSYQIYVDRDPSLEGDVAGMTGIVGQLLAQGTTTRTKAQIDESIDFVGGSLNTNAQGGFASGLTRHSETILTIFADVILNPSFPEAEFEKIKKQTISGLQTDKDDPNAISANVSNALSFGAKHPYGEITTELTVQNTTLNHCKEYYQKYFKPNISYLVVVGDINAAQAKAQATKYFGAWKRGNVEEVVFPMPAAPAKTHVHFVDKAGAVQSVINITYPVNLKPGTTDIIPARVMNTILGSGFSGRLFKNLREDKAYTYGAYSALSEDEFVGDFSANAAVRNEVTDSAIAQFMYELNRLRSEEVTDNELLLAKNFIAGQFARSLEGPETIAGFALNTFRYHLPADYYATYLEKLEKVTKADVMAMAKKYIQPDQAHIVVVGNQDAVSEKLVVFDMNDSKVDFYDIYANKKADPSAMNIQVSGAEVVKAYIDAIGGEAKLNTVKSMKTESTMVVQGMGEMTVEINQADGKLSMVMGMPGMTIVKQVYDGQTGFVEQMGQRQAAEGEMLEELRKQANIFPELTYFGDGYTLEVKGIEDINGEKAYKVNVTGASGTTTEYYSVDRGYKLRLVTVQGEGAEAQTVVTDYNDYRLLDGMYFPYKLIVTGMAPFPLEMNVTNMQINPTIDPAVFSVN